MVDEQRNNRIVQRGLDEAFACRDMLGRATVTRQPLVGTGERLVAWARRVAPRGRASPRRVAPAVPVNTLAR